MPQKTSKERISQIGRFIQNIQGQDLSTLGRPALKDHQNRLLGCLRSIHAIQSSYNEFTSESYDDWRRIAKAWIQKYLVEVESALCIQDGLTIPVRRSKLFRQILGCVFEIEAKKVYAHPKQIRITARQAIGKLKQLKRTPDVNHADRAWISKTMRMLLDLDAECTIELSERHKNSESFQEMLSDLKTLKKRVTDRDGHRCHYCHRNTYQARGYMRPTIDHIIPKNRGGTDDLDNCVIACWRCNQLKRDMPYQEFKDKFHEIIAEWKKIPIRDRPSPDKRLKGIRSRLAS